MNFLFSNFRHSSTLNFCHHRAGSHVGTPSPQSTPEASLTLNDNRRGILYVMIVLSNDSDDNLLKLKETKITDYLMGSCISILPTFRGLEVIASLGYFPQKMTHSFRIIFVRIHSCHFLVGKERICQFLAAKYPCRRDIHEPRYAQSVEM